MTAIVKFTGLAALCLTGLATHAIAKPLIVYTPQAVDRLPEIEAFVEDRTDIDVEFVNMGGGAVYDRVLAERNNPQADVIFGLIDFLTAGLKLEGVLQPYELENLEGLPAIYRDPDGYFYGYRQTPITLSYNADLLSAEDAPKAWEDLADPEWNGKFMIGALTWQTTRAILAGLFTRQIDSDGQMTDEGWDWFNKFYGNAVIYEDGMNRAELMASGENVVSLNHYQGVQSDAANGGYDYAYVNTVGGTPIVVERNAILAGTDNLEDALAFLEVVQSVEFQVWNAETFGVIPVHPDAIAQSPAEIRAAAEMFTTQAIDWDLMAENLDGWLERIQLDML